MAIQLTYYLNIWSSNTRVGKYWNQIFKYSDAIKFVAYILRRENGLNMGNIFFCLSNKIIASLTSSLVFP